MGKNRLVGDTEREVNWEEGSALRKESAQVKEAFAVITLENRLLNKSVLGVRKMLYEISRC